MSSNDYLHVYDYIPGESFHRKEDDRTQVRSDVVTPATCMTNKYLPASDYVKLQKPSSSNISHGCSHRRLMIICIGALVMFLITNAATGFVVWTLLQSGDETTLDQTTAIPPEVDSGSDWYPWTPWSECSSSCGAGQATRTRTCPVEDQCKGDYTETQVCLPGPCLENIAETCGFYGGIYPHEECQAFFNCSEPNGQLYHKNPTYMYVQECRYPDLFDTNTNTCKHFKRVDCNGRKEFWNNCDYLINRLITCHFQCPVCYSPRCEGLPDGRNVYQNQKCSKYYVTCDSNRTIGKSECMAEFVFDPDKQDCFPLDFISPKTCTGGYAKNCTSLPDGQYRYDGNNPSKYSVCSDGKFDRHEWCPYRHIFSEARAECVPDSGVSC